MDGSGTPVEAACLFSFLRVFALDSGSQVFAVGMFMGQNH